MQWLAQVMARRCKKARFGAVGLFRLFPSSRQLCLNSFALGNITRQTSDACKAPCGVKFDLASFLEPHLLPIGGQIAKGDGIGRVVGASTGCTL